MNKVKFILIIKFYTLKNNKKQLNKLRFNIIS
jgi:hypothetical protein